MRRDVGTVHIQMTSKYEVGIVEEPSKVSFDCTPSRQIPHANQL